MGDWRWAMSDEQRLHVFEAPESSHSRFAFWVLVKIKVLLSSQRANEVQMLRPRHICVPCSLSSRTFGLPLALKAGPSSMAILACSVFLFFCCKKKLHCRHLSDADSHQDPQYFAMMMHHHDSPTGTQPLPVHRYHYSRNFEHETWNPVWNSILGSDKTRNWYRTNNDPKITVFRDVSSVSTKQVTSQKSCFGQSRHTVLFLIRKIIEYLFQFWLSASVLGFKILNLFFHEFYP